EELFERGDEERDRGTRQPDSDSDSSSEEDEINDPHAAAGDRGTKAPTNVPYFPAVVDNLSETARLTLLNDQNLAGMSQRQRMSFLQVLIHEAVRKVNKDFEAVHKEFEDCRAEIQKIREERVVRILRSQIIVGATIVGASIHTKVLQRLRPDVVVVEEAAEVLEPLLLPCLGPWVKHLIMIGDHQQLPP
ncbi:unnamed protein product, partial [Amoebophrya sp. A120]